MTPHPDYSNIVRKVSDAGYFGQDNVDSSVGVRPVINLLKSSIE